MTNVPPHGWRAGIGFVPPADGGPPFPGAVAMPVFASMMPSMPLFAPPGFFPGHPVQVVGGPPPPPPPPPAAVIPPPPPPAGFLLHAIPGAPAAIQLTHGGNFALPPLPPPAAPSTTAADRSKQSKGSILPGGARAGYNHIFAPEYCYVHAITGVKASAVTGWGGGTHITFNGHQVPTSMSVVDFVAAIDGPDKWILTEVFERPGGGGWMKGTTVKHGDDRAKKSIADLGWDGRRGTEHEPVWCILEKEK